MGLQFLGESQKGTKTRLAAGLKRAATKVGEVSAAIAYVLSATTSWTKKCAVTS
jgi:hypothetical protein